VLIQVEWPAAAIDRNGPGFQERNSLMASVSIEAREFNCSIEMAFGQGLLFVENLPCDFAFALVSRFRF
jgi:hypothetical protein